jgi:hypothetical protein
MAAMMADVARTVFPSSRPIKAKRQTCPRPAHPPFFGFINLTGGSNQPWRYRTPASPSKEKTKTANLHKTLALFVL